MNIAIFVIWIIVGIINTVACAKKIKADWVSYWLCYICLITQLLDKIID